jgi:hypothetical protein
MYMESEACCKVSRAIEEYDISYGFVEGDVNRYLLARWKGKNEFSEEGIRPLKDWINQKILKAVYTENGRAAIESNIVNEYEVLTGEDNAEKMELLAELEENGIDGESLEGDFVSESTVYRHFKKCLDEDKSTEKTPEEVVESAEDRIEWARNQAQEKVETSIQSIGKQENSELEHVEINVAFELTCPECGKTTDYERARRRGFVCSEHHEKGSTASEDIVVDGATASHGD